MFKSNLLGCCLVSLLALLDGAVASSAASLQDAVRQSESAQPLQRKEAFDLLADNVRLSRQSNSPVDDSVRRALIGLLGREATLASGVGNSPMDPEAYDDYLHSLVQIVVSLKDPRAAPVLCTDSVMTTGNMALRGLGELGNPAAMCVIGKSRTRQDSLMRVAITLAAGYLVAHPRQLTNGNLRGLIDLLRRAAHDRDPSVRTVALQGLMASRDPHNVALVRQIAASDPYHVTLKSWSGYPVRDRARSALAAPQ